MTGYRSKKLMAASRHADPVTIDHIIELRKENELLKKQLENALSYVAPLREENRRLKEKLAADDDGYEITYSKSYKDAELSFNQMLRIEQLERELKFAHDLFEANRQSVKFSDKVMLTPLVRVNDIECPKTQIYGLPICWSNNRMWPWPNEDVALYAAWKRL